jgi:uncharacterized LabA/DUF88 family protein
MKKYAFIDVQNTDTTTKKLLGFEIDWKKLYNFLINKHGCEKVFLYTGIDEGDIETAKMFENLEKLGCIVRSKISIAYKNKDKILNISCPKCNEEIIETIDMGYRKKSNCDVDLTVDAMDLAKEGNEFYIFTGDGDFEFLIRNLYKKKVKIHIVSSPKKIRSGKRHFYSRYSTKLRKLVSEDSNSVDFLNINNFRFLIKK